MENEAPGVYSFTTILSENRPTGEIFVFIIRCLIITHREIFGHIMRYHDYLILFWQFSLENLRKNMRDYTTNPGGGFSQYHWCFRFYGAPSSHLPQFSARWERFQIALDGESTRVLHPIVTEVHWHQKLKLSNPFCATFFWERLP